MNPDPEDERIAASVAQHGWHCIVVDAAGELPSLAYTIGLVATFDHPELVMFGLRTQLMYDIFREVVADSAAGNPTRRRKPTAGCSRAVTSPCGPCTRPGS